MHWFWRAAIAILIPVVGLACLEEVLWELPALMADYFGAPTEFGWIGTVVLIASLAAVVALLLFHLPIGPRPYDPETRCRKCGYILRGITEPRCPECGERI